MSLCIAELMKENWDPDFQPPRKKAKRTKVAIDKRFDEAKGADEVAGITKGYVPPNTAKNTTWAMRVFEEWRCAQKKKYTGDEVCGAILPLLIASLVPRPKTVRRKGPGFHCLRMR